ncbi:MAG: toll/interleukin-1 receptor domain-containing protein [Anaerolineales bacterium]|nr:toll/interleukin-1 receptor domain-containing protein [Anaerolineales bacterium]
MPQVSKTGTANQSGDVPLSKKLIPFLSYSKINKSSARDFAEKLKSEGWIDPWFDEEDILPGQVWEETVTIGVRNSHAVIILLSKAAMASEGFFHREIKLALDTAAEKPEGTIFIIPIRLNDCEVPALLQKYQYVDYFGREEQRERMYTNLISALKVRAENLGIKI